MFSDCDFREEESPNMNNSCLFVREPPDGCEKVKIVEDTNRCKPNQQLIISVKILNFTNNVEGKINKGFTTEKK